MANEVELTFVRRATGIEVTCRSLVPLSDGEKANKVLEDLAVTMLEAIENIDGTSGYKEKRENDEIEKAKRLGYARGSSKERRRLK